MKLPATLIRLEPARVCFFHQHETDPAKVCKYRADMRNGDVFPPVRLVDYNGDYMIVDGHHRVEAMADCEFETQLLAWVVDGEAFEDFDSANRHLGLRADDEAVWP